MFFLTLSLALACTPGTTIEQGTSKGPLPLAADPIPPTSIGAGSSELALVRCGQDKSTPPKTLPTRAPQGLALDEAGMLEYPREEPEPPPQIEWFQGPHMSALGKARSEQRPLLVYFWMDGSAQCKRLFGESLSDAKVVGALDGMICQGIDIATGQGAKMVQQYGVVTLPTLLFLDSKGERLDAVLGFIAGPQLVTELNRIKSGVGTVKDFRQQLEVAPDDLALMHRLAVKLRDIGDQAGHDELVATILERDPKGETPTGARLAFWAVRTDALKGVPPKDVELKAVKAHAKRIRVDAVAFEAWTWIAGFEFEREQRPAAREAFRAAFDCIAEADVLNFGMQTARTYWLMRDELDRKDKSFMLKLARLSAERARKLESGDDGFGNTEWEAETYEQYLAMALDSLAMAEYVNGHSKAAIALLEESLQLWPDGEEFAGRLELIRDGR